jgi:hypothetical protein
MTGTEPHENGAERSVQSEPAAAQFTAVSKKGVDGLIAMQSEFLEEFQQVGRGWFNRMEAETALASEMSAKMSSAHSFPEAASIFQEWTGRRMKLAMEDTGHLMTDAQRLMTVGTRALSQGLAANGSPTRHSG